MYLLKAVENRVLLSSCLHSLFTVSFTLKPHTFLFVVGFDV